MKKIIFCCLLIIIFFTGCTNNNSTVKSSSSANYVEAKEMIINNGALMVDVRTKEEYDEKHIDGAISLPLDEITSDSVSSAIDDKNAIMIVYCKSGSRSSQAVTKLNELGYNNVYDFGAMSNWRE